ncbi:MAG: phosphoserine phosphatase SerB [Mariprofundaceae bacterium]
MSETSVTTCLPPSLNAPGLLMMDMDSTLICCECIDEIADFMGIKADVAEITQRAMEGELDFSDSLYERVQLLAGLDASVLNRVYEERIRLNEGAERLIKVLHQHQWKVGLVSGGFDWFTNKLQRRLHLDFSASNQLEVINDKLTGRIMGTIVDANAKKEHLLKQAEHWRIPLSQTVAIGDGANDLPMIEAAALGIAFHAKPKVSQAADYAIADGALDQVLDLLQT